MCNRNCSFVKYIYMLTKQYENTDIVCAKLIQIRVLIAHNNKYCSAVRKQWVNEKMKTCCYTKIFGI